KLNDCTAVFPRLVQVHGDWNEVSGDGVNDFLIRQRARPEPCGVASATFQRIISRDPKKDRPAFGFGKPLAFCQIEKPRNLLPAQLFRRGLDSRRDRKSTRLNSSHGSISY